MKAHEKAPPKSDYFGLGGAYLCGKGEALEAELPVLILVLISREDGLYYILVLGDLACFDTEEVLEGHRLACEAPFADSEDEVPLT